jgi:hypothetical protein
VRAQRVVAADQGVEPPTHGRHAGSRACDKSEKTDAAARELILYTCIHAHIYKKHKDECMCACVVIAAEQAACADRSKKIAMRAHSQSGASAGQMTTGWNLCPMQPGLHKLEAQRSTMMQTAWLQRVLQRLQASG